LFGLLGKGGTEGADFANDSLKPRIVFGNIVVKYCFGCVNVRSFAKNFRYPYRQCWSKFFFLISRAAYRPMDQLISKWYNLAQIFLNGIPFF
jgi:hypothetical protein